MTADPCQKCEELLQGYLDRELAHAEYVLAQSHLDGCDYCKRRYTFEATLRRFVRTSAAERMPPELMEKLLQLRGGGGGLSAS